MSVAQEQGKAPAAKGLGAPRYCGQEQYRQSQQAQAGPFAAKQPASKNEQ